MSSKNKKKVTPQELETIKAFVRQYETRNNKLMEHTAQTVLPLISYVNNSIENMVEHLDENTAFSQRLRNRGNHAIKACEEFIEVFEGLVVEGGMDAFAEMCEILFPCLDSWFGTVILGKDVNPTLEVTRRAKLRYHEPYKTAVKEQTAAFEDGYTKGYCDCVNDVTKELAKLVQQDIETAVIKIDGGKVNIEPVLNEKKP